MTRALMITALLFGTAGTVHADHRREALSDQYRYERDRIRKDFRRREDDLRRWYDAKRGAIRRERDRAVRYLRGQERSGVERHFRLEEDQLHDEYRRARKALDRARDAAQDSARHRYDTARRDLEHLNRHGYQAVRRDRDVLERRRPAYEIPRYQIRNRPFGVPTTPILTAPRCNIPTRSVGGLRLPVAGGIHIRF